MDIKTDKEKLVDLLTEFDVEFYEKTWSYNPDVVIISCKGGTKGINGNTDSSVEWYFYQDGKFVEMGVWK